MSIKIYDGLVCRDTDVFEAARSLRTVLEADFAEQMSRWTAHAYNRQGQLWETEFDGFFALHEGAAIPDTELRCHTVLYNAVADLHSWRTRTLLNGDIGYDFSLMPNSDPDDDRPLALVFGEQSSRHTDLLIQHGVADHFPYWNNTDRPAELSQSDWDRRRQAWSCLIDRPASPNEAGVTVGMPSRFRSWLAVEDLLS